MSKPRDYREFRAKLGDDDAEIRLYDSVVRLLKSNPQAWAEIWAEGGKIVAGVETPR